MTDEQRSDHHGNRDDQQTTEQPAVGPDPVHEPHPWAEQSPAGAPGRFGTSEPQGSFPSFTHRDDRRPDAAWDEPAGSYATTGDGPAAAPRRRRRALVPGVAALLAAALVGGGAGYVAGGQNDPTTAGQAAPVSSLTTSSAVPASDTTQTQTQVESVAQSVTPTVVQITEQSGQSGGTGSGAIIGSDGLILTNNHVVAGAASGGTLAVTFSDGTSSSATIVGRDPVTDLAVIRARTTRQLPVIALGDSATLRVGQQVVAFGSPLGLSGTVTTGIVSALNRPVTTAPEPTPGSGQGTNPFGQDPGAPTQTSPQPNSINALQTDAAINPGNSGGPLVDLQGRLIGLNSAIASLSGASSSGAQSGSIGLGFSIPVNQLKPIVAQLEKGEKATHAKLGVGVKDSTASNGLGNGAALEVTDTASAAAQAGLKTGDVVTKINSTPVPDAQTLVATVRSASRPGEKATVTYLRDGRTATTQVTLGSDG